MLDYYHRIAVFYQAVDDFEEYVDVLEVQTCRRFVEDVERALALFSAR